MLRKMFGVVAAIAVPRMSPALFIASAIGLCASAPLLAADPQLIADAKAFGARVGRAARSVARRHERCLYNAGAGPKIGRGGRRSRHRQIHPNGRLGRKR